MMDKDRITTISKRKKFYFWTFVASSFRESFDLFQSTYSEFDNVDCTPELLSEEFEIRRLIDFFLNQNIVIDLDPDLKTRISSDNLFMAFTPKVWFNDGARDISWRCYTYPGRTSYDEHSAFLESAELAFEILNRQLHK